MPDELRPYLIKSREEAERFSYEEFVGRVADLARVVYETAEQGIAAVFHAMYDVVGPKEFHDFMSQLPKEFSALAPTSQPS
jgi:uncharacterized protein (DUF2267 family)